MIRPKLYLFLFALFLPVIGIGQHAVKLPAGSWFGGYAFADSIAPSEPWNELSRIFFFDPSRHGNVFLPRTGGLGSATHHVFSDHSQPGFIKDGFDQFDQSLIRPWKLNLINDTSRRITQINYHLATRKEQRIFLSHQQKILPWFMAGLGFGAMTSPGDFSRQLNTNRKFNLWLKYESPSAVYRNYSNFTSNRIRNQENGGITNDTIFENASSLDTRTLPVFLDDANIRHKYRDYWMEQELNLAKLFGSGDTNPTFNKGIFLQHNFWWNRKSVLFTSNNPDSGYFQNFYVDSVSTYDSSFVNRVWNSILIDFRSPVGDGGDYFTVGIGAAHEYVDYYTGGSDTLFENYSAKARASYHSAKLQAEINLSKVLSGDFIDSWNATLSLKYHLNNRNDQLYFETTSAKTPQTLRNQYYQSNHFRWINNFPYIQYYTFNAGIEIPRWNGKAELISELADNRIFYREDYLPQVYEGVIAVSGLKISKTFSIGKYGIDEQLELFHSGNEQVVNVPLFATYTGLFYRNNFFRNALGFKAGIDLNIHGSYNGYGYMPATGIFYIQDEKEIGQYPMLGVYVQLKIKTALLHIRLDHFNAGISERTYYGAYRYPLQGRTLKFGVNWRMKN
jgi:hypothetical protein